MSLIPADLPKSTKTALRLLLAALSMYMLELRNEVGQVHAHLQRLETRLGLNAGEFDTRLEAISRRTTALEVDTAAMRASVRP